jgi:flavin reductase (DIM6/NTAB) family NADH-FMN oxidoreductase RutF
MPVEAAQFKETLACWASGVTVITTVHDGAWKGATASSFTSLSLHPPTILVALATKLYTRQLISTVGVFAASILADDQAETGKLFAGMYPEIEDRFSQAAWETAHTGAPVLRGAAGWVDCTVLHTYEVGDHTIFIGQVEAAHAGSTPPVLYHRRQWGRFAP